MMLGGLKLTLSTSTSSTYVLQAHAGLVNRRFSCSFQAPERLHPFVNKVVLPRLSQITFDEACKELDVFCTNEAVASEVLACMPTMEEALRLCDIYFENSKFM